MTRHIRILFVVSFLLFNGSFLCLAGDKWTDSSGTKTIEADFVKLDGIELTLKNSDGKEIVVPLQKLDTESRALEGWPSRLEPPRPWNPKRRTQSQLQTNR